MSPDWEQKHVRLIKSGVNLLSGSLTPSLPVSAQTYAVLLVRRAGQRGRTLLALLPAQSLRPPCRRVVRGHGCARS